MEASEKLQCWVCRTIIARTEMYGNWEQEENEDWDGEEEVNLEDYDFSY